MEKIVCENIVFYNVQTQQNKQKNKKQNQNKKKIRWIHHYVKFTYHRNEQSNFAFRNHWGIESEKQSSTVFNPSHIFPNEF